MPTKERTKAEILSEMADLIVGHLKKMDPEERKSRIKDFGKVVTKSERRSNTRP
jgi:hypothetical protein